MKTPVKLTRAMNSLTKHNEWGGDTEMLEDILAPNDWRLKAILDYREEIKIHEKNRVKQAEVAIRRYFTKNKVNNPYVQAMILRKLGTDHLEILKITGLSKYYYQNHVAVLFHSMRNYGHSDLLSVEAKLRNTDLKTLLGGIS